MLIHTKPCLVCRRFAFISDLISYLINCIKSDKNVTQYFGCGAARILKKKRLQTSDNVPIFRLNAWWFRSFLNFHTFPNMKKSHWPVDCGDAISAGMMSFWINYRPYRGPGGCGISILSHHNLSRDSAFFSLKSRPGETKTRRLPDVRLIVDQRLWRCSNIDLTFGQDILLLCRIRVSLQRSRPIREKVHN